MLAESPLLGGMTVFDLVRITGFRRRDAEASIGCGHRGEEHGKTPATGTTGERTALDLAAPELVLMRAVMVESDEGERSLERGGARKGDRARWSAAAV